MNKRYLLLAAVAALMGAGAILLWPGDSAAPAEDTPANPIWVLDPLALPLPSTVVRGHGSVTVSLGPEGQQVATLSANRRIELWDPGSGGWLGALAKAEKDVTAVALGADWHQFAWATPDPKHTVYLRKAGGQKLTLAPNPARVRWLALDPTGAGLVAGTSGGTLTAWNDQAQVVWRRKGHAKLTALTFGPAGRWVAAGFEDGLVWVRAMVGDRVVSHQGSTPIRQLRFFEDQVLVADEGTTLWSLIPDRDTTGPSTDVGKRVTAWHQDGDWLALGHQDGSASVWDLLKKTRIDAVEATGNAPVTAIALDHDVLFVGDAKGAASVHRLNSRHSQTTAVGRQAPITSIVPMSGGHRFIVGSESGQAYILATDLAAQPAALTLKPDLTMGAARAELVGARAIRVVGEWRHGALPVSVRADGGEKGTPQGAPGVERVHLHARRVADKIEVQAAADLRKIQPDYTRLSGGIGGCALARVPAGATLTDTRRAFADVLSGLRAPARQVVIRAEDALSWAALMALASSASDHVAPEVVIELAAPELAPMDCPGAASIKAFNQIARLENAAPSAVAPTLALLLPRDDAFGALRRDPEAIELALELRAAGYDPQTAHAYPSQGNPSDPLADARADGLVIYAPTFGDEADALRRKLAKRFPRLKARPRTPGDLSFDRQLELYLPVSSPP